MSNPEYLGERAWASLQRGIGYARRAQWQQDIKALESALADAPDSLEARYQLALCFGQMGRARDAVVNIEAAMASPRLDDANRVRFLRLLARVSMQSGDYNMAAHSLEEAFQITGVGGAPILNNLAQVMCKSGDFEKGFDLFFQAMNQSSPRTAKDD